MKHEDWKSLTRTIAIQSLTIEIQDMMIAGGAEAVALATRHVDNHSQEAVMHERICGNALIVLDKLGWLKEGAK